MCFSIFSSMYHSISILVYLYLLFKYHALHPCFSKPVLSVCVALNPAEPLLLLPTPSLKRSLWVTVYTNGCSTGLAWMRRSVALLSLRDHFVLQLKHKMTFTWHLKSTAGHLVHFVCSWCILVIYFAHILEAVSSGGCHYGHFSSRTIFCLVST